MIYTFKDFLLEANSAGSKFEQKIANNINKWLKKNKLDNKFKASRFQSIKEEDGNREEDYSDVVIEDLETKEQFFVECKEKITDNIITTMFDIQDQDDFPLVPVKDKSREEVDDELLLQLASDIQNNELYQKFGRFLKEETENVKGGFSPADFYFNKQEISEPELTSLIKKYNKMVKSGKVEADNKPFDDKLIRESTRNLLAVGLMWRLYDPGNTWDICHLEDIPYFGELIKKHYLEQKEIPAKYLQTGDCGLFLLGVENPLGINCPTLPEDIQGKFDLKFTPRFGSGAMYITPRSKVTSKIYSETSFASEKLFPEIH